MTSREENAALVTLARLLATDLTTASLEDLAAAVSAAESAFNSADQWSGRLIAELRRRDVTYTQITELTGLPRGTASRRRRKYLDG